MGNLIANYFSETKEVLPSYYWKTKETSDNVLITDELRHDLNRIYDLLIRYGVTADRNSCLSEDSSQRTLPGQPDYGIFKSVRSEQILISI